MIIKWLKVVPSEDAFTTFVLYDKEWMLKQNKHTNVAHPNIILSTKDFEQTYQKFISNSIDVGELQQMPNGKIFFLRSR